jgi:hypothetical protein
VDIPVTGCTWAPHPVEAAAVACPQAYPSVASLVRGLGVAWVSASASARIQVEGEVLRPVHQRIDLGMDQRSRQTRVVQRRTQPGVGVGQVEVHCSSWPGQLGVVRRPCRDARPSHLF